MRSPIDVWIVQVSQIETDISEFGCQEIGIRFDARNWDHFPSTLRIMAHSSRVGRDLMGSSTNDLRFGIAVLVRDTDKRL